MAQTNQSMSPPFRSPAEERIKEFEVKSGWRVSLPARIVIQQTITSIQTDRVGLIALNTVAERRVTINNALQHLPAFLNLLAELGKEQAEQAAARESASVDEMKTIGAIFLQQHMKKWAALFECPCWPE